MRLTTLLIFGISTLCIAQRDYKSKLSERLKQLKAYGSFTSEIVDNPDTFDIHGGYPYPSWDSLAHYIASDRVRFNEKNYEAMLDNIGKNPDVTGDIWYRMFFHPYRFLRDTAIVKDLVRLTRGRSPLIKSYAYAALSQRNYNLSSKALLEI